MKQRIVIKNFGPIKDVDLDINKYTLFIGPNALGKSTIAKLVYFCRRALLISVHMMEQKLISLSDKNDTNELELILDKLSGFTCSWFSDIWDIGSLQDDFEVHFYSTAQDTLIHELISITKSPEEKNNLSFVYSDAFKKQIIDAGKQFANFYGNLHSRFQMESDRTVAAQLSRFRARWELLNKLGLERDVMFIPAGRQAFAIPKDERPTFSQDFFMKWFYEHSVEQKKNFREPISQKIDKIKENSSNGQIECLGLAQNLMSKILKGEYVSSRDDERIYIDNDQYVKLYEASSGQQESLWILNSIYSSIEQRREWFTIIEEPEAHLYPETQKAITELISLLANQPGNQVMLTTHSPYILTALNNLIYAHKVGNANGGAKRDEMKKVIDENLWVDINDVAAYQVKEDGKTDCIIDGELGLIDAEAIDSASQIIADEFDTILKLEN